MINRDDSRGHLYSNDRGEILGLFENKRLLKQKSRMFSLISLVFNSELSRLTFLEKVYLPGKVGFPS